MIKRVSPDLFYMKLIMVRHGETKENAESIMQGQEYGTLSEKGKEQVEKVAERLKNFDLDHIFSSDLERTRDTAEKIAKYHETPIQFAKEIRERDAGVYNGKPVEKFVEERESRNLKEYEFKPQGGEDYQEVKERTAEFLEKLIEEYQGKTVLLVSHGTAMKIMTTYLLNMDLAKTEEMHQYNTAVNVFEFDGEKVENHILNDTEHLKEN